MGRLQGLFFLITSFFLNLGVCRNNEIPLRSMNCHHKFSLVVSCLEFAALQLKHHGTCSLFKNGPLRRHLKAHFTFFPGLAVHRSRTHTFLRHSTWHPQGSWARTLMDRKQKWFKMARWWWLFLLVPKKVVRRKEDLVRWRSVENIWVCVCYLQGIKH